MRSLKKVKIINWHYFWNETINIEPIVFLTGLNASGKSTLIDALQLILLGDTTGRYFNKAAMEKSNRTLKGYLRGELGDTLEG
ncbi:MAG TPA: ATP-binding protein, partial [Bacilli bacterium]|nr:ATP-binding protein [Bacilli bacterium]